MCCIRLHYYLIKTDIADVERSHALTASWTRLIVRTTKEFTHISILLENFFRGKNSTIQSQRLFLKLENKTKMYTGRTRNKKVN